MRPDRRLCLNAAAHLLVDGLCAATVFGALAAEEKLPLMILVYNTLAFSTQCLVGLAADRLKGDRIAATVSMLCIVLGYLLPVQYASGVVAIVLEAMNTLSRIPSNAAPSFSSLSL